VGSKACVGGCCRGTGLGVHTPSKGRHLAIDSTSYNTLLTAVRAPWRTRQRRTQGALEVPTPDPPVAPAQSAISSLPPSCSPHFNAETTEKTSLRTQSSVSGTCTPGCQAVRLMPWWIGHAFTARSKMYRVRTAMDDSGHPKFWTRAVSKTVDEVKRHPSLPRESSIVTKLEFSGSNSPFKASDRYIVHWVLNTTCFMVLSQLVLYVFIKTAY